MPAGELSGEREQAAQRARNVLHSLAAPAGDARAALRVAERLRALEDNAVASALAGLAPFAALAAATAPRGTETLQAPPGRGALGRTPRPPASARAEAQTFVSTGRAGGGAARHGPAADRVPVPAARAGADAVPDMEMGGNSAHDPLAPGSAPAPPRARPLAWAPSAPLPPPALAQDPADFRVRAERTRTERTEDSVEALGSVESVPRGARAAAPHSPSPAGTAVGGRTGDASAQPSRATDPPPASRAAVVRGPARDAERIGGGARPAGAPHDPLPEETRALLERLLQAAARRSGAPTPSALRVRAATAQTPAGDTSGTAPALTGRRELRDPAGPAEQPVGAPAHPARAEAYDLSPRLPTTVRGAREREEYASAATTPSQAGAFGFRAFEDIAPLAVDAITRALDDGRDAPRTLAAIVNEALMEQARLHGVDLT